jgi:hypothetical protein
LPSASGIHHGLFTVQNTGDLEQFCCKNQRECQQNKLFLGKTIVINSINSVSVIRNSDLMRARRLGRGFGPRGKKEKRQTRGDNYKMETRERNLQLKQCC